MQTEKVSFFKSIGAKIMLIIVAVVLLAIGAVTYLAVNQSSQALMTQSFHELEAVREIKKNQLESYRNALQVESDYLVEIIEVLRMETFAQLEAVQELKKAEVERFLESRELTPEMMVPDGPVHRRMNAIVQSRVGMGETGESYLIENEGDRFIFRSDMQTMGGGEYVYGADKTAVVSSVDYIQRAARGEAGGEVFSDSNGNLVAVVYDPVEVSGRNWIMVTKKDLEEALALRLEGEEGDVFTDFNNEFGYYDLFLIHPEGRIFYSVTHEADYQTDIIDGKFSDSGLGEAVRSAIAEREFAFADFAPYEPTGGKPASFIAEPIVHSGEVELVVALQLPLTEINSLMQERAGMGETGETYLVGPDHLMRSDSYLDPEHHSVTASFADPERGDVRTEAVEQALSGETDEQLIIDYNGNPVLSAYTPVDIFGTTWAMLAEIDETEVRAPINTLTTFILISALVMVLVAAVAAVLFSRTISGPITTLVGGANRLAVGDIQITGVDPRKLEKINARGDELGRIGSSFSYMIDYQKEKVGIAEKIAAKDLSVNASVSSEQDTLGKSFREMVNALNMMLAQVSDAVEQVTSGSDQVSQASQNLSQGATEQASSLEQITSSANQINSQTKQNAENAKEALSLAKKASADAEGGNSQMEELSGAMEKINASSEEINKVVKAIDDIAFQINLLALNANVEAARAGKYGKGFAVVADEVRNLAVKSADSVRETTTIVEETIKNIQQGTEATEKTAGQLQDIVEGSNKVANFLEEIAQASSEQSQALDQISNGLEQIDEVTQSNTASAEESASASEELAGQAQQLRAMVAEFTLAGGRDLDKQRSGGTSRRAELSSGNAGSGGAASGRSDRSAAPHAGTSGGRSSATGRQGAGASGGSRQRDAGQQQRSGNAGSGNGASGWERESETGIRPVQAEDVIKLDDDEFDRF